MQKTVVVRVNDRRAKGTVAEPDKAARRHRARVDVPANNVVSVVDLLRVGKISSPRIIKSCDHFDRD